MEHRPRTTTARTSSRAKAPRLGLRLHAAGERLGALLKERDRLLRDVQKKKLQVDQAIEKARQSAEEVMGKVAPIMTRYHELSSELNQLFEELLAPGRLSANARKKVARVRRMLVEDGLLDDLDDFAEDEASCCDEFPHEPFEYGAGSVGPEVASAAPRGQAAGHESLRTLFKRLALAIHPDRADHETDRERRTEAMKQVTQAYENGDLARLLELEKVWQAGANVESGGDEEARCRELEKNIDELRAQATELSRELRQTKKYTPSKLQIEFAEEAASRAKKELGGIEKLCAFVKNFRDGKISLADFVRGPDLDDDDLKAAVERISEQLMNMPGKTRAKGRKPRMDDIPF